MRVRYARDVHSERHFRGGSTVRDAVLGMADGLTVPFALAAGLSGALADGRLILTAGLAEIAAGAVAMGLGGYLAARGEADHYHAELAREQREVRDSRRLEEEEVVAIFGAYGLSREDVAPVLAAFRENPAAWVDFMMRFELGLERPEPGRAWKSASVIAAAYVLGGIVPLAPYALASSPRRALAASAAVTLVALFTFGATKARLTGAPPLLGALQTTAVGAAAAAAAYGLAQALAG